MKIKELLLEGLSPTLYHATKYFTSAFSIIQSNEFRLSETSLSGIVHTRKEILKYPYYLSMARTVQSSYFKRALYNGGVIFELDGTKLGYKHKGKQVDFFAGIDHATRLSMASRPKITGDKPLKVPDADKFFYFFEYEDRLYSKKKIIPNADEYIRAIHFILKKGKKEPNIDYGEDKDEKLKNWTNIEKKIRSLVKKVKPPYPVYIHKNEIPMEYLDKRKAEKIR